MRHYHGRDGGLRSFSVLDTSGRNLTRGTQAGNVAKGRKPPYRRSQWNARNRREAATRDKRRSSSLARARLLTTNNSTSING